VQPSKRKRHKLDLSPISVDEVLSNPALSGIERTLRDLVAVHSDQPNPSPQAVTATLLPRSVAAPSVDRTSHSSALPGEAGADESRDQPMGEIHTGDSPSSDIHTDVTHIGIKPSGRANQPLGDVGCSKQHTDSNQLDSVHTQRHLHGTHIGDAHIGDLNIGVTPICDTPIGETIIHRQQHSHPIASVSLQGPLQAVTSQILQESELPIGDSHTGFAEPLTPELAPLTSLTESALPGLAGDVRRVHFPSTPRYRQKVRAAADVQDGHSTGEQILYQALWRAAKPDTEETRLITIGYGGMHDLAKLDKTNCKKNLLSLIRKLAVDVINRYSVQKNIGNTYRIHSYSAILRRRKQAGMVYVVRANGVRFVTPDGRPLDASRPRSRRGPQEPNNNLPTGDSPTIVRPTSVESPIGISPLGSLGDSPIAPMVETPIAPVGVPPTLLRKDQEHTEKNNNSSSSTSPFLAPPSLLVSKLQQISPSCDNEAVQLLWAECLTRARDCTAEEVLYFVNAKASIINTGRIQNPIGFLLAAVPKCFEGETFQHFRQEQARLREEQQRREEEERQTQKRWEAEAEQYRREEEAREKAKQLLPTLSEEERNRLYQEAKADYSAKTYTAPGSVKEKILYDAVIRNLTKRILAKAQAASS